VFSNLLPGSDSFVATGCSGNVISETLLNNGRLALAPLFRLSAVTSRYAGGQKILEHYFHIMFFTHVSCRYVKK
jgi:hypothetical protein